MSGRHSNNAYNNTQFIEDFIGIESQSIRSRSYFDIIVNILCTLGIFSSTGIAIYSQTIKSNIKLEVPELNYLYAIYIFQFIFCLIFFAFVFLKEKELTSTKIGMQIAVFFSIMILVMISIFLLISSRSREGMTNSEDIENTGHIKNKKEEGMENTRHIKNKKEEGMENTGHKKEGMVSQHKKTNMEAMENINLKDKSLASTAFYIEDIR